MNTENYTKILIQKTLWSLLLVFGLLCSFSAKAQDCMLLPMTLQERVQTSLLIIEGEVLSQQSFWNQGHQTIYTLNKVKVYKVFKGYTISGIIDVITEGGTVGMERIVHSSTLSLSVGDMGVLMCIPNPYTDSGVAGYTPYGSLAGFMKYETDGTAHDPYHKYNTIEASLYNSIKNITNLPVTNVAANPKLNAITNKQTGNSGNTNKNGGGGNQVDATPTITSFTPTTVAAGIGTTITITGTNFKATQGTGGVEFKNADDGGATYIRPLSTDYVSWSDTQIVVKVPSTNASGNGAGTGQIRVVNSDASSNTATSSQTLTVTYGYSNLIYDNTARMATHIKDNTAGGYTMLIDQTSFASVPGAVSKLSLVMDRWTCASGINWLVGGNTTGGVADDGLNIACYSATLPASVLARCTSYYSGCGTTPFNWYVKEIDVAVKSNLPGGTSWYYGTGSPSATEYDFETVMLHEIGHGHQLNHVIDATAVMHYAVGAGQTKRTLNAGDIAGSTFIKNRDLSVGGICGQSAMTLLGCGAANAVPIVNFSADKTNITAGCSITFTSESLPQATSWSWNFNGGATNSTQQNPTVTFNTPGTYTVSLTANNAAGPNTLTRTNYIVVTALTCSATPTNWTGSNVDYNAAGSGKLIGHNAAGDLAFADKFLYCGTATKLTQLKYYFNVSTGTGNITAKVWNANGAGGAPGTELFSQTAPISTLPDFATPLTVTIPSGLLLTSDYYIGFEIAYAGADAVSLISNAQGESTVSSAWRKSSGGAWNSFLELYGSSLSLKIDGVINNAPTATISAGGPTTFCSGSNVVLTANAGSGLTYQWFNGATNTGITTQAYTATTSGSYTVRTTYSGCTTTSSPTVVTVNNCASTNANLNNLVLSAGTLNPVFSSVTTSYTASVPNATASITVTPTVADATATVKVNNVTVASGSPSGSIPLNVGSNVITTVVTAQDGTTTKTYTVTVTRAPSSNANLSNLVLSSGTLNPVFAQASTSYTASVPNATTTITVTPTVADATATVTVNSIAVVSGSPSGNIPLNVGSNIIIIIVTAQDASTKTYTVTVTRAGSSNNNLSNLTLSSGTLNPAFAQATTSYTTSVSNATTAITVTPTVADATATVTVNSTPVTSGSPSGSIPLVVGSNTITIIVTAQDASTKTYNVNVTRAASTNNNLSNLTLSSGTLNPVFAQAATSYTASVSNATTAINVTPTVADATATVTVNSVAVVSGTPSGNIPLNIGANVISILVTAQNGATKTYTITVNRTADSNADLSGLSISAGTLNPSFASGTLSYSVILPSNQASVSVTPTASVGTSTITVNGLSVNSGSPSSPITLTPGNNTITIVVTAQSGATQTYTITVTKRPSAVISGTQTICSTSTTTTLNVVLTGTPPWNLSYFDGGTSQDITIFSSPHPLVVMPVMTSTTYTITGLSDANTSALPGDLSGSATVTVQIAATYYADADGDGFGNAAISQLACSPPILSGHPAVLNNTDCNDNDANTFRNATFFIDVDGDGYDNGSALVCYGLSIPFGYSNATLGSDCDDNNADAHESFVFYADNDSDTFGSATPVTLCAADANTPPLGYVTNNTDCDDNDISSYQSAILFIDFDGDGYDGGSAVICYGADIPAGYIAATLGTDCDDNDNSIFLSATLYIDNDGDGYDAGSSIVCAGSSAPPGFSFTTNGSDCDDNNNQVHAQFSFYVDFDGDTYGSGSLVSGICAVDANTAPFGYSTNNTDCDPNNAAAFLSANLYIDADGDGYNTGTQNVCYDGLAIPAGFSDITFGTDCDDFDNAIYQSATLFIDLDGDGYDAGSTTVCYGNTIPSGYSATTLGTDCDDTDDLIFESVTLYIDADGDGYDAGSVVACAGSSAPVGFSFTTNGGDCDDNNASAHQQFQFYADTDGDGYGAGSLVSVCAVNATTPPVGYSLNDTDCAPTFSNIHSTITFYIDADGDGYDNGTEELCTSGLIPPPPPYSFTTNGPDCDDSDANVHEQFSFYADADGDTYGTGSLVTVCAVDAVTPPAGYSLNNTDCNDANANAYQSATLFIDFDGDGYDAGGTTVCYGATVPVGYIASSLGPDCNDSNPLIHEQFTFYVDNDGDGYGTGSGVLVCAMNTSAAPIGYALNNTDCNDTNNTVYQSATLYVDADFDGYTSGVTQVVCYGASIPAGFLPSLTLIDCNDTISAIHPNATEIPFNGVDDNCNGSIDETGSVGVTTTLLPSSCGVTLAAIGSLIGIQTVGGHPITGYRIRATNGAQVQIIETTVPHFTMPQFASYAYATTYTIEIQLQRAGIWLTGWGAPCLVSTPAILEAGGAGSINPSQCGITLAKINTLIATTSIAGVTGYRFRVTNLTDPFGANAVQTIDRTQNWFSLQMLTRYNYGTLYRIEVAVKTTGTFGGYGAPCEVASPAVPTLINCGATIAAGTTTIGATSVSGATQYRFQITRDSDGSSTTIDRNNNWFTFNMVPALVFTPGGLYNVRVAVMTAGTWSPFGDVCQITAPGGTTKGTPGVAQSESDVFRIAAYPTPFTTEFNIDINSSSRENIELKVYDMLGKLIESRAVKFEDLGVEKVGTKYPSGVYNVVVSQDGIVKTLRVIKR